MTLLDSQLMQCKAQQIDTTTDVQLKSIPTLNDNASLAVGIIKASSPKEHEVTKQKTLPKRMSWKVRGQFKLAVKKAIQLSRVSTQGALPFFKEQETTKLKQETSQLISEHVKKEQVAPIIDIFQKLFDGKIQQLTLLVNGRGTSKIYRFSSSDEEFILRVTDCTRSALFIDVESEVKNMRLVNDLEIAPRLHHADPKTGVIVMGAVRNIPLTTKMLDDREQGQAICRSLATSLKKLHKGPNFSTEPANIFRNIEVLLEEAGSRMPQLAQKVLMTVMPLEQIMAPYATSAPCHRDLHSSNVLFDGKKIFFIDWELALNSDPVSDLGFVSMFFLFTKEHEELFLETYYGKTPTASQKAYFFLMKQVCIVCFAARLMRRVCVREKIDLSKEEIDLSQLSHYRDFILENYNDNPKPYTIQDRKNSIYYFLREVSQNSQSVEFQQSKEVLAEGPKQ